MNELTDSLDPASMLLMEKLNKIEASVVEQGTILIKLQESASALQPALTGKQPHLEQTSMIPSEAMRLPNLTFQVPTGGWASLDYFMSLPFIKCLIPDRLMSPTFACDNYCVPLKGSQLPNLHNDQVKRLVDRFVTDMLPLHPILEATTVERLTRELEEDGLAWTGETAIILLILAIRSLLDGEDCSEYMCAAKRRAGIAMERLDIRAIQAHYLQG